MRHYLGMQELLWALQKWGEQTPTLVSTYAWTTQDEPCWLFRRPMEAVDKQPIYRISTFMSQQQIFKRYWLAFLLFHELQCELWFSCGAELLMRQKWSKELIKLSFSNTCKSCNEFPPLSQIIAFSICAEIKCTSVPMDNPWERSECERRKDPLGSDYAVQ